MLKKEKFHCTTVPTDYLEVSFTKTKVNVSAMESLSLSEAVLDEDDVRKLVNALAEWLEKRE